MWIPSAVSSLAITPGDAQPWVKSAEAISNDELALLIFGDVIGDIKRPFKKITAPCVDERNQHVLVAVTLVQFGAKEVKLHSGDGYQVSTDASSLVAVTLEACDFVEHWKDIVSSPFKYLRSVPFLREEIISIWGKSFRLGQKIATPDECSSVQVHMLAKTDSLPAILKAASGARLWCTPKSTDGKPDSNWRLLWLDSSLDFQAASVLSAKLPAATGLIRVKGRFAVRVSKTNYESSWKILFPSVPMPEQIDVSSTWRIDNLPYGVTRSTLVDWSMHLKWAIRPLRAMGPRGWIVAAASPPPEGQMHFNASPILLREVAPRAVPSNPIVAGPRPKNDTAAVEVPSGSNALPPLRGDPWSNWKPSSTMTSIPVAPSAVGPTEQKFALQEARFEKLEAAMEQLQTNQASQQDSMQQLTQELNTRDIDIRKHLDSRLGLVKQQLDTNFTAALQQQSNSFEKGLQDLKQLLVQRPKRTRGTEGDAEMEEPAS